MIRIYPKFDIDETLLEKKEWKEFWINDIFENIQRGKRLTKKNQIKGNIPYISSKGFNNGIDAFIGNTKNIRIFENCLSIANSGSVGSTFYHPYKFIASDHVTTLKNKTFNKYHYVFISNILKRLSNKYNFNREISDNRIKREKILLPIKNNQPDLEYMEKFIKEVEEFKLKRYLSFIEDELKNLEYKEIPKLEEKEWKDFKIEEIFKVYKGSYLHQKNIIQNGKIPYITAQANNNGIKLFIGNKPNFKGNSITIEKVKLTAFYQPYDFYCSHDVSVIQHDNLNKYNALFIASMIKRQGFKYSYGRQAQMNVVKRETLFCPVKNNQPDWEYMEQFIKNIIYKKLQKFLNYKNF